MPETVIDRAKELVDELVDADITSAVKEIAADSSQSKGSRKKAQVSYDQMELDQISLFDTVQDNDILEELKNIDVGNLTPIDALNTIYRLQTKLKNRW